MVRSEGLWVVVAGALAVSTAVLAQSGPQTPVPATLGRQLAESGDFHALLKTVVEAQIGELQRDTAGLTAAEKAKVAQIGQAKFAGAEAKINDELGPIYDKTFKVEDLKQMVAFFASPAGKAYTGRYATTMPAVLKALSDFDFKHETLKTLCVETGKACTVH